MTTTMMVTLNKQWSERSFVSGVNVNDTSYFGAVTVIRMVTEPIQNDFTDSKNMSLSSVLLLSSSLYTIIGYHGPIVDDKEVCVVDTQCKQVLRNIAFHSQLIPWSLGLLGYLISKRIVQIPSTYRDGQFIFLNTKLFETTSTFGNCDSRKLAQ